MREINHAMSTDDGIICYSNICPMIGVRTYYNEEGKIEKEQTFGGAIIDNIIENNYIDMDKKIKEINEFVLFSILAFFMLLSRNIIFPLLFFYLYYKNAVEDYYLFYYMVHEFKTKKGHKKSLARFHGAEHMAINAFNEKKALPTMEEVKKASRYSKYCGTMKVLNNVVYYSLYIILFIIAAFVPRIFIPVKTDEDLCNVFIISSALVIILIILFELIYKIIEKNGLLKFMQVFVTSNPTQKELSLAIEAIKNLEELETQVMMGYLEKCEIVFSNYDFNYDEEEES